MRFVINVEPSGEGLVEDINYLMYNLAGRPGGDGIEDNLRPVKITSFQIVEDSDDIEVILECDACNMAEYIGNFRDISYREI